MNEDGTHQNGGNDTSAMGENGPQLDSETGVGTWGKSIENSPEAAASEYGRSSRMQPKISEAHNDFIRHSSYGLWIPPGAPIMGNVDWRNQGSSHESSLHWPSLPSLLPVSSVPVGKNIPFECLPQMMSKCRTDGSATSHNSGVERAANSDGDLAKKLKDAVDVRPAREPEQFNLWKMASLIRDISPSADQDRRDCSDTREETLRRGLSMDVGKMTKRSWISTCGQNDHHLKAKSLSTSSTVSYSTIGSETANSDFDSAPPLQLIHEKRAEGQVGNSIVELRHRGDQLAPSFIPSLIMVEQPENRHGSSDVFARTKQNAAQSTRQLSETTRNQHQIRTGDIDKCKTSLPHYDAMKETMVMVDTGRAVNTAGDKQVSVAGSSISSHCGDITGEYVGASRYPALPAESASSALAGLKTTQDKALSSDLPVSESNSNGSSLYRRRVKNLLLKRGNSLTEGSEADMPKSPRIPNDFGPAFERGDSSPGIAVRGNGCGNFHEEKCHQEHKDEVTGGTDVALCHSPTESDRKNVHAASSGCHSGRPFEQENVPKGDKLAGISCGVVNYATVSSKAVDEDHPLVSAIDCRYTGQLAKDVRSGCVEKGFLVNAGGLCCHSGGCGVVNHSAYQHCTNIGACHVSPSCHLPVKVPPTAACDAATGCCITHRLGALSTPTRACAAALCQLSCSGIPSHAGSPQRMETASGCLYSQPKSGNWCMTPCHQAVLKYVSDGRHQSGCAHGVKKSLPRSCSAKNLRQQDYVQQPVDAQPHTPCMAHTPYTPRETYTPREPDTPQDSNAEVCEPCTPQGLCSRRTRKCPRTPTTAYYFQFPPLLDCSGGVVCHSPCVSYARRLSSCRTPCMSPLNLTVGQPCVAHSGTPQCCFQHPKMTSCADHHRHNCVRPIRCLFACFFLTRRPPSALRLLVGRQ